MTIDSARIPGRRGSRDARGPGDGIPAVRLVGLTRHFGDVVAVAGIDLEIAEGEFFSMLGPRAPARRPPCG